MAQDTELVLWKLKGKIKNLEEHVHQDATVVVILQADREGNPKSTTLAVRGEHGEIFPLWVWDGFETKQRIT